MRELVHIIDKPNERSSHTKLTIRGGGILFLVAVIVAGIMHPEYWLPVLGATIIGVISFLDDRITLSSKIRIVFHHSLPIEQFVLYMGKGRSSMATRINASRLIFNYQLIAFSQVDYKIFLQSDKSEEKILALLANFGEDKEEVVLQNILKGVQESVKGDLAESSYFRQLRILAQLRKIDIKFMEAMETITKYFKEERDPYFRKGKAEGKLEKAIAIAREMKKEGMPIAQIARFTKVSAEEIEKL